MPNPRNRNHERGGATILLVLIILSLMAVAGFSMSSNSLRELSISGNESTGAKAAEAADAGLDWCVTWGNPLITLTNSGGAATLTAEQQQLQTLMGNLINAIDTESYRVAAADPTPDSSFLGATSYGTMSSTTGALRVFLRSGDYPATAQLFLDKTSSAQTSSVQQAFDMELRYLGKSLTNQGSGVKAKKKGSLFLLRGIGRANVGTDISFLAQREILVDYLPE